jgi:hypothetical protein
VLNLDDRHIQKAMAMSKVHTVFIDSRKRGTSVYPHVGTVGVEFASVLKNVVEVRLVYAMYGRAVPDGLYLNLMIPELNSDMISNSDVSERCFTQLPTPQEKHNVYHTNMFQSVYIPKPALGKLSKLTAVLVGEDGSSYNGHDYILRFEVVTAPPASDTASHV